MPFVIDLWDMRNDQQYLYAMAMAISSGVCDPHLAARKPGPMNLKRWLTFASRILRVYVTKSNPSEDMKTLTMFIMKVYVPFHFIVKNEPQAIHGSRHLFKYIQMTRLLPKTIQEIIQPRIQHNAYYCHPENILLSMITDEDKEIRFGAYKKIIESRGEPSLNIREFVIPKINFDSETYETMIDWGATRVTEPPCIQFLTQEELMEYAVSEDFIDIPGTKKVQKYHYQSFRSEILIAAFPCHNQNTERYIKIVSESCKAVVHENRLGHIFSGLQSRERYTKLESRKHLL